MDLSIRIDWLTFTLGGFQNASQMYVIEEVVRLLPHGFARRMGEMMRFFAVDNAHRHTSHKPYSWGLSFNELQGFVIMGSPLRDEVAIELQGAFCARFPDAVNALAVIVGERVTRLDLACDVKTVTLPSESVVGHRAKTNSFMTSSKGDTVYLGSEKSEVFARIYRYNPPHPRSDLLRSEIVYKRKHAQRVCEMIGANVPLITIASDYWQKTGLAWWLHQVDGKNLSNGSIMAGIRAKGGKVQDSKRYWLSMQVDPALEKMFQAGMTMDEILGCLKSIGVRLGYPTTLPE